MKIYKHEPIFYIRLTFKRRGDKLLYLPLIETNLNEVEVMLQTVIRGAKIDPLERCSTTTIEMREAKGGVNGAYRQLSFKGLSPEEVRTLVIDHINSLNEHKDRSNDNRI